MWDEKYDIEHYLYGKMPNDFLVGISSKIPKGDVLCLADGEGRNSVFLARSGYQVTGVDSSKVAIEKANKLANENGVEATYQCVDLDSFDFGNEQWEGIVSIFCHLPKALRQKVHQSAVNGLKKGGVFVLESYISKQLEYGTGGPKEVDLLPSMEELKSELKGLEWETAHEIDRVIMEGSAHFGPSAVVQLVGVKN